MTAIVPGASGSGIVPQSGASEGGGPVLYSIDFREYSETWASGETKTVAGIDFEARTTISGFTGYAMDSAGLHGVGGGSGNDGDLRFQLNQLNPNIDVRTGTWAFLLEFDADASGANNSPRIEVGDKVSGDSGNPWFCGFRRQVLNTRFNLYHGYNGVFRPDQFATGVPAGNVRAIGMVVQRGQYLAYYDNNGGSGPGQVHPQTLTFGMQNSVGGSDYYCTIENHRCLVGFIFGVNLTRLTVWDMTTPST